MDEKLSDTVTTTTIILFAIIIFLLLALCGYLLFDKVESTKKVQIINTQIEK